MGRRTKVFRGNLWQSIPERNIWARKTFQNGLGLKFDFSMGHHDPDMSGLRAIILPPTGIWQKCDHESFYNRLLGKTCIRITNFGKKGLISTHVVGNHPWKVFEKWQSLIIGTLITDYTSRLRRHVLISSRGHCTNYCVCYFHLKAIGGRWNWKMGRTYSSMRSQLWGIYKYSTY